MEQITITRAEYRELIVKNPRGYGIVRFLRDHPEEKNKHSMKLFLEELTQLITLKEIELELFGDIDAAEEDGTPG